NHDVSVSFRSTSLAGAGLVLFSTRVAGVVDAKVSRPDGTGAGEGAAAQLVLITREGRLVPLLPRTTFRTSSEEAAYYINSEEVAVPGFAPGQEVTLRMLAWIGESFDRATLRGQSKDLKIMLGGGILPPSNLTGLEGFTLNAPANESLPLIVEQPKGVNAHFGSAVSFSVKAVGSGPLTFQWKHNGATIDGATSPTLTLKAVKTGDEGNYTAVVSNSMGSTTSAPAHLNVKRKRQAGDFDDDGNPDILLIGKDRTLAFWLMNGVSIRSSLTSHKLGEGWKIVGTGDFNKDGKTDVLLQNEDGSLAFWLMEGTSITEGLVPLRLPEGWHVAATGDFNNDDQTDILLRDREGALAFWLMDGTTVSQVVNASFKLPDGWQLIGAGDFNNDGETDLLLRHSSRALAFWLMDGTTLKEGLARLRVPEGWQVIGLGDFNHDGQTDMMLRHNDHWLAFWFMNGMDIAAGEVPMKQPDGWEIVGRD
ncbi:MAG: FG-GAP-like repeat-containing protein, partial [Verrucomicrobiales bacterium]|nr:FG-GAP-like repeat-containing protein [Verrucomicrobiales bacterium]